MAFDIAAYDADGNLAQEWQKSGARYIEEISVDCQPAAPTGLQVVSTGEYSVDLSWADARAVEDGFRIYRDGAEIGTVPTNTVAYAGVSADCDTTYSYEVGAFNGLGESAKSQAAQGTTSVCTPNPPADLVAMGKASATELNWNDTSRGEDGYIVERSMDAANWSVIANLPRKANHTPIPCAAPRTITAWRPTTAIS